MNTNLKKNIWTVVGIIIIAGSFVLFFSSKTTISVHQVVIDGKVIKVEIAQTAAEREHGLSGHEPLTDNEGMLFIFDQPGPQGFWMKDMLFPLDIVWLAPSGVEGIVKIVDITRDAKPESFPATFSPAIPAQYVLEVNANLADKNNWVIGDEVKFLP